MEYGCKLHLAVGFLLCQKDDFSTDIVRLIEMWLGIVCTCLPLLYTFFRTQFVGKRNRVAKVAFPAIRDPNSDLIGHVQPLHEPDSGYYSGRVSNMSLETIDTPGDAHTHHSVHSVRLKASDKNLLVSASRCSD